MKKRYSFVDGAEIGGTLRIRHLNPQSIGLELSKIEEQDSGLTPKAVVNRARARNNPLHDCFEWDNSVAGEEYRNIQAAQLIRVVRVIEHNEQGENVPVRAFLHISNGEGPRYITSAKVMADASLRELAINEAKQYLERAKSKLAEFKELESVYRLVDRAGKKLSKVA